MTTAEWTNYDIVCLGSQPWDSHWCTPQQTMSRLAHGTRILYVEPWRSLVGSILKRESPSGRLRQVMPNLWVYTLPALAIPFGIYGRIPPLQVINNALLDIFISRIQRRLGFGAPVYWVYQVTHAGSSLLSSGCLLVYDCIDEWAGATSIPVLQNYIADLDRRLCAQCDLLFVGSKSLLEARRTLNMNVHLVPQGVDLNIFLQAARPDTVWPGEMRALPRPVIGLIGVLDVNRLDVDLLCHVADQRPHLTIALVGPVWSGLDVSALQRRQNVYLLGNKPREQLGSYLASFDVCILPYLLNDFTRNIYPLKLNEYLASGKPFVATSIPACRDYPDLIRVAESAEQFVAAIDAAVLEQNPTLRAQRIAVAMENDWERRVQDKVQYVNARLLTTSYHRAAIA